MLKDLLADLQQGAARTKARRTQSQELMSSFAPPTQPVMPTGQAGHGGRKGKGPNLGSTGNNRLDAFLQAIATQESGGNYGAKGVQTKYGRAYGKYQILDSNIEGPGGWDKEALGRNITIEKFLKTPRLQEKIARAKLTQYFKDYGALGAAKAWYAGPGNANTNSNAPQYGGPSINSYAQSVREHMREYL